LAKKPKPKINYRENFRFASPKIQISFQKPNSKFPGRPHLGVYPKKILFSKLSKQKMSAADSIGMMNKAYAVPRGDILNWINEVLGVRPFPLTLNLSSL
jgi:hypothetical protein